MVQFIYLLANRSAREAPTATAASWPVPLPNLAADVCTGTGTSCGADILSGRVTSGEEEGTKPGNEQHTTAHTNSSQRIRDKYVVLNL